MTDNNHLHPSSDFGYEFHSAPVKTQARRRVLIVIWMSLVMMIAEVIGGLWTHSLALLSDAGHMLTHVFSLVLSYIAIRLAARAHSAQKTFGYHRAEPISAAINGVTIFVIVGVIFIEAIKKMIWPEPVHVREMFIVAVAGLIVNLVSAVVLHGSARDDINIKGAFVHLLSDALSSIAIVVGGGIMLITGWYLIDPILSLVIGVVIAFWGYRLLKDSFNVLLEATPPHIDLDEMGKGLLEIAGVREVHDVHVWEVTSGRFAMTCHLQVKDMPVSETERIRDAANAYLSETFRIGHSNIQFETWK